MHRISGLDGIRALAITLVIGLHLDQRNHSWVLHRLFAGQDGVNLFFVLSGFLVTALLFREHAKTGKIHIPDFYFRRAMRIAPPLLAYLLVVVILAAAEGDPLPLHVVASVVFFYHNISASIPGNSWMVEHTWSLAIEEQFYLLWPVLLAFALKGGRKRLAIMCLALIAIAPVLRVSGYALHWEWMHYRESFLLPTRMDALLSGCLLAAVSGTRRFEALYKRVEGVALLAPVFLFVVSPALIDRLGTRYAFTVGLTLNSLVAAYFVLWLSRHEDHVLGRIANHRAVTALGVMSYSVYLWQTLATHYAVGVAASAAALGSIALAATASFYLVEKPAMAARNNLRAVLARLRHQDISPAGVRPPRAAWQPLSPSVPVTPAVLPQGSLPATARRRVAEIAPAHTLPAQDRSQQGSMQQGLRKDSRPPRP